ncbi:vimentin-type intermediate filament-associated coiled-coil protein [Gastrophryne carolinensis]
MSALNAIHIKEANAHLAALHQRVAELEGTIREQAESLIRKDEHYQAVLRDVVDTKDREITEIQKKLVQSEEENQKLKALLKDKNREQERFQHHSHLLAQICQRRPLLDALISLMAEAEGMSCLSSMELQRSNGIINAEDYCQSEDLEDSDIDRTLFGTTV